MPAEPQDHDSRKEALLPDSPGTAGAKPYSPLALFIYDFFVLKFMAQVVWRCSTSAVTLPFFRKHIARGRGKRHLDIGVGTGWFLQNAMNWTEKDPQQDPTTAPPSLTLCDLNANCLHTTTSRLALPPSSSPTLLHHDILTPFPPGTPIYDSISLMYLLHCLPCPQPLKVNPVLAQLRHQLHPTNGVLFGCTVLGPSSGNQTWLSRLALRRINRKGRMGNLGDTEEGFVDGLTEWYARVETCVVGSMLVFVAREPRP